MTSEHEPGAVPEMPAVAMTADPGPGPDGGRGGRVGAVLIAGSVLLGALGLAIVPGIDLSGDTETATSTTTTLVVSDACSQAHAAHNEAMWDPTSADEMLEAGCPWPYEPFLIPTEGGAENPNLAAPFEARRYGELWDALQAADLGVCSVGRLADPPGDGFVFGFRYEVRPGGCEAGDQVADLVVREHVTRAWRDTNALELAAAGPVLVLGRWTFSIDDGSDFAANRVFEVLVGLGAVTAGGSGA